MAEVVLGLAASHGPPVTMPASQWHMLREKDQKDKRMDYSALLAAASPSIADDMTLRSARSGSCTMCCARRNPTCSS
jgi:hypothetical protein